MSDYEVVTQHNVCIRTSRFTFTTPITRTPHAKLTTHSTFDFAHTHKRTCESTSNSLPYGNGHTDDCD